MNERNLLIAVLAALERERTVSIPQLARLLGVDEERVWDALDVLVFCYDSVSVRLDLHEAHATLETGAPGRLLRLNESETGLLLDALEAQGFSPDDPLCGKLLDAKGFLARGDSGSSPAGPRVAVRTVNTGNVGDIMETIARACDDPEHHLLRIAYQKEGAAQPEERVVEPRAFVSEGDHRYLQAYCRNARGWRTFRTDRIGAANLLEERFEPRDGAPEMAQERKDRAISARVRYAAGVPLPSWPGLRVVRENEDGSCEAAIPWLGGLWLPKRIVGMLGDAVPLEPPELVDATRGYAESLLP